VFPTLRARAGRQSTRDEVAFQLHPVGQGHHVAAFLVRDRDRVLGEGSGHVLQRQAVLADVDDVVQPLGLLAADAVIPDGDRDGRVQVGIRACLKTYVACCWAAMPTRQGLMAWEKILIVPAGT
jgi:hypothetical protein